MVTLREAPLIEFAGASDAVAGEYNMLFQPRRNTSSRLDKSGRSQRTLRVELLENLESRVMLSTTVLSPTAPNNLALAVPSTRQINLTWTDNSNNETGFVIQRSGGTSGTFATIATVGAGVTSYSDLGLLPGTTYTYEVAAINSGGSSAYAGPTAAKTAVNLTFVNQSMASQNGTFTAEFDATPAEKNEDVVIGLSSGPATWYDAQAVAVRFNQAGTIDAINGGTANYTALTSLNYQPGVNYHFKLVVNVATHQYDVYVTPQGGATVLLGQANAFRSTANTVTKLDTLSLCAGIGAAPVSNFTLSASAPLVTVPAAPSNLALTVSSASQINLTWTDNSNNETGFVIQRQTGSDNWVTLTTTAANATSFSDATVTASTQYSYRVLATNDVGTSSASNTATATTPTIAPPSGETGTSGLILTPGTGWTGPTAQPATVGQPGQLGYKDNAIARWDVVPYQTFSDTFNVGVVAFDIAAIDHVAFSVNGGAWVNVTAMTKNPQTNVVEYWATLRASDFAQDGTVEVRAVAYPTAGVPRVLDSLILNANGHGTLPNPVRYVSPTGSDTSGDGTSAHPFASIIKAANSIGTAQGNTNGGTIYLMAGNYNDVADFSRFSNQTVNQWLTITHAPGLSQSDVKMTTCSNWNTITANDNLLLHYYDITFEGTIPFGGAKTDYTWIDHCQFNNWTNSTFAAITKAATGLDNIYVTDTNFQNVNAVIEGAELVRNVKADRVAGDLLHDVKCAINVTVTNFSQEGASHTNVYQDSYDLRNVILYGITSTSEYLQAFQYNVVPTDHAIVNCNINTGTYGRVIDLEGVMTNVLYKDNTFKGVYYVGGLTPRDLVFDDCTINGLRLGDAGYPSTTGVMYR
jgi:hypothetical protein